jgi:hypothetical protein
MELWKTYGYCLLSNIIDQKLLYKSTSLLQTIYHSKSTANHDFGSDGKLEFPTGEIIDQITLNESLIDIVKILLDDDIGVGGGVGGVGGAGVGHLFLVRLQS